MLVPDGPAVAYTLAKQPDLVQRLNTLPPPLVLVELGRLSAPPAAQTPAVGSTNGTTTPGAATARAHGTGGRWGRMVAPSYSEAMNQKEYEQWRQRTSQLPYLRRG